MSITALSTEARAYLWSPEVFDGLETLVKNVGGGEDQLTTLHADVIALCEGTMTEEEMIEGIKNLLGLERMKAMALLDEIVSSLLGKIKVVDGVKAVEVVQEIASSENLLAKTIEGAIVKPDDHAQDEQDLAFIKEKHAPILTSVASLDVPEIVKTICENPAFQFSEAQLQERCAKLVESRVRDVRTPEQTRSQLERSVDTGGLGVTGRRLADILEVLEASVVRYQQEQIVIQEKGKGAIKEARQKKETEKLDFKKQEDEQLAKRYAELTRGVRTAIEQSKTVEPKRPAMKANTSMQEIAFIKRLVGPVEELKTMSLTDFRRLSKDSRQAATKVKDKVGLLEGEGYDKKIEGIKAWRSSPLMKLYMDVTREAVLKGVPIQDLLATRRAAKEETLTDEELSVIMAVNGELRF